MVGLAALGPPYSRSQDHLSNNSRGARPLYAFQAAETQSRIDISNDQGILHGTKAKTAHRETPGPRAPPPPEGNNLVVYLVFLGVVALALVVMMGNESQVEIAYRALACA